MPQTRYTSIRQLRRLVTDPANVTGSTGAAPERPYVGVAGFRSERPKQKLKTYGTHYTVGAHAFLYRGMVWAFFVGERPNGLGTKEAAVSSLLTAEQLAQKLQVRKTTVAHWARIGTIPSVRIGPRIVRFDLAVVYKALGLEMSA